MTNVNKTSKQKLFASGVLFININHFQSSKILYVTLLGKPKTLSTLSHIQNIVKRNIIF